VAIGLEWSIVGTGSLSLGDNVHCYRHHHHHLLHYHSQEASRVEAEVGNLAETYGGAHPVEDEAQVEVENAY